MKSALNAFFFVLIATKLTIAQNSIQSAIENFASRKELENASISFQVKDLSSKSVVAQWNSKTALPTASTAKLFATATAFEVLGAGYRPKTRIYMEGTLDSKGVLHGNIWIRGGGDPGLGSKHFSSSVEKKVFLEKWAIKLKDKGILKIEGKVIADASEFGYAGAPDGWSWSDMGNYYGAGPSGLTIYDNLVEYYFSVPGTVGAMTKLQRVSPTIPGLMFNNYIKAASGGGDNSYIYGAPYSLDRFGTGTLPAGQNNFLVKGSLPDPELQFAYEFEETLKNIGIDVDGGFKSARNLGVSSKEEDYSKRELLITHEGETLEKIISETNMKSINLFAEHLICLIGYVKKGDGSTETGLKVLNDFWASKMSVNGLNITDGSGLSRTNAISAQHMVDLLVYMKQSKNAEIFFNSLPIAGVSGTLKNVCKNESAHNRMFAKSGSMARIRSYGGYIKSSTGKEYAFSLIVNNYSCSSSEVLQLMETVFNKMAVN